MVIQSLEPIASVLRDARSVAICGHIHPDGDCIGSVLALTCALRKMGVDATPLIADAQDTVENYAFMPCSELLVHAANYTAAPDVFIALDVPNLERMSDGATVFARSHQTLVVDHHSDTHDFADLVFSRSSAAAAGLLVWDLIESMGIEPDADIANCCYVAVVTDTGRFQFQNTDAEALEHAARFCAAGAQPSWVATNVYQNRTLASMKLEARVEARLTFICDGRVVYSWVETEDFEECGATREDGDNLTDTVRSLGGIEVAVLFRVEDSLVRGSLRSKNDVDVASIANTFGGGGHRLAAGFTSKDSFELVVARLSTLLEQALA